MDNKQAIECLKSIDILKYRDDDKNYFFEDVKGALDIAIKSLEAWDKVKEDIKQSQFIFLSGDKEVECIPTFVVMNIINRNLKEIEE